MSKPIGPKNTSVGGLKPFEECAWYNNSKAGELVVCLLGRCGDEVILREGNRASNPGIVSP